MQPMEATYAIGIIKGDENAMQNELHLNPLRSRAQAIKGETVDVDQGVKFNGGGILQLRPSFTHLNEESEPKNNLMDIDDDDSDQLQKVKAKRQTKKQERIKNWEKNTYSYKRKEFEAEPFVNLQYNHFNSSFLCMEKIDFLYYADSDKAEFDEPFTMTPSQYLDCVVGEARQPIPKSIPYGVCSRNKRETLPIPIQLVQLMRAVVVMHYERIKKLISEQVADKELITHLENVAIPIDGVWVVQR